MSAISIALLFAIWSDSNFKEHDITGKWILSIIVDNARLKRYNNMSLIYYTQITQSNNTVLLNAEKTEEYSHDGTTIIYKGRNRTTLKCSGSKKYNYFSKNKLILNCTEYGKIRSTALTLILSIETDKKIIGTFMSSASESSGRAEINKLKK